jgi:hypothetical protein
VWCSHLDSVRIRQLYTRGHEIAEPSKRYNMTRMVEQKSASSSVSFVDQWHFAETYSREGYHLYLAILAQDMKDTILRLTDAHDKLVSIDA